MDLYTVNADASIKKRETIEVDGGRRGRGRRAYLPQT
jgi:hypothetical protein